MRVFSCARLQAALVAGLAALALSALTAGGAEAKLVKLVGQTKVTPSAQAAQFLSANGVSVSPTGPATANAGVFTFPIVAGFAETRSYTGIMVHSGGLMFAKEARSLVFRRFIAVRTLRHAVLLAQVPGLRGGCALVGAALRRFAATHPRALRRGRRLVRRYPAAGARVVNAVRGYCAGGRVVVLGQMTNLGRQVSGSSATLTADLRLSREAAGLVNGALGTQIAPRVLIATVSSSLTTS